MGKLAKLKPREKCSVYCPVKREDVEVTKWQTGNEYAIICQEPWMEDKSPNRTRAPCGYDRRCSILNDIFLSEVNGRYTEKSMRKELEDLLKRIRFNRHISGLVYSAKERLWRSEYLMMEYLLGVAMDEAAPDIRSTVDSISLKMRQLYKFKHPMDSKAINPKR